MKIAFALSIFLTFSAQAQLEALGPLDRLMFELNFNKHSKSQTPEEYKKETALTCLKSYKRSKEAWLSEYKKTEGVIAESGYFIGYKFTKEEMLNMPNENVHKVKQTIRGTDVLKYESVGTGFGYPHALPRCKDFYKEEVQKMTVGNKACRKVIFSVPDMAHESYAQVYCEGSNKLYITYDSTMEVTPESLGKSDDCVACLKK